MRLGIFFGFFLPSMIVMAAPMPKAKKTTDGWNDQYVLVKEGGNPYGSFDDSGAFRVEGSTRYLEYRVQSENEEYIQILENGKRVWCKKEYFVRMPEAIRFFSERIEKNPKDDYSYAFRAWAHRRRDDLDKAILDYNKAIEIRPQECDWYNNRGLIYLEQKELDKAIDDFTQAIQIRNKNDLSLRNRGHAYAQKKEYQKAIADYEEAMKINDKIPAGYQGLAHILATSLEEKFRDGNRAKTLAIKGCELTEWKDGSMLDTLACAYAELGEFEKAIEYQTKALSDPHFTEENGDEARKRLQLFRENKPYRHEPKTKKEKK